MQWFGKKSARRTQEETRPDGKDRLPPGQYLTKKWPVLSYERTPQGLPAEWRLKVTGKVEHPLELTWEEFLALPRTTLDRKSTRLNSSHSQISYAVFCLTTK